MPVNYRGFPREQTIDKGEVKSLFHVQMPMLVRQTQNVAISVCRHMTSPPRWLDKLKALDSLL